MFAVTCYHPRQLIVITTQCQCNFFQDQHV
jgi:hypothetical protein